MTLVVRLDRESESHVAVALRRHIDHLEHTDRVVPADLRLIADHLASNAVQRRPNPAIVAPIVHADVVSMTYDEAAAWLDVSKSTVRRRVRTGALDAFGAGSGKRILVEELERHVREGSTPCRSS